MKTITFPDGQSVLVRGIPQFAMQSKREGQTSIWWSMDAAHAWSKANTVILLQSERVIYDIRGDKVAQTIPSGQRATMPGQYR